MTTGGVEGAVTGKSGHWGTSENTPDAALTVKRECPDRGRLVETRGDLRNPRPSLRGYWSSGGPWSRGVQVGRTPIRLGLSPVSGRRRSSVHRALGGVGRKGPTTIDGHRDTNTDDRICINDRGASSGVPEAPGMDTRTQRTPTPSSSDTLRGGSMLPKSGTTHTVLRKHPSPTVPARQDRSDGDA